LVDSESNLGSCWVEGWELNCARRDETLGTVIATGIQGHLRNKSSRNPWPSDEAFALRNCSLKCQLAEEIGGLIAEPFKRHSNVKRVVTKR